MNARRNRNLLLLATVLALSHFGVVVWHLQLLVGVQPETPKFALMLLIGVNLIPVMGLVAFAKGHPTLAGWMIILPFGVALAIGGYTHFLSTSTDNVFRMPSQPWRVPFQVSAVLLALLEALSCWVAVRMLSASRSGQAVDS